MKVVYIAGPYRAAHGWLVAENIAKARFYALRVWGQGHAALCPHLNTAHFDGVATEQTFIDGTLELMRRCDAVFLIPGWEDSLGAVDERDQAISIGLPIFRGMNSLIEWMKKP